MSTVITLSPATSVAELAARHAAVTVKLGAVERKVKAKIGEGPANMTARMMLVVGIASTTSEWLKELDVAEATKQLEAVPGQEGRFTLFGRDADTMKDEGASLEEMGTGMFQAVSLLLAHLEALVNRVEDEFAFAFASNNQG